MRNPLLTSKKNKRPSKRPEKTSTVGNKVFPKSDENPYNTLHGTVFFQILSTIPPKSPTITQKLKITPQNYIIMLLRKSILKT